VKIAASSTAENFVRGGAVNDVLSLTVPSVYFLTVENWYKAPVKVWTSLSRGGMASSGSFWLCYCQQLILSLFACLPR